MSNNLNVALTATTALYLDAQARGDEQAMRYYAQAVRCLLGPTRKFLSPSPGEAEDLEPQPEWPLT
jgi:hypothetical protein